jgi:hypothetical protein
MGGIYEKRCGVYIRDPKRLGLHFTSFNFLFFIFIVLIVSSFLILNRALENLKDRNSSSRDL